MSKIDQPGDEHGDLAAAWNEFFLALRDELSDSNRVWKLAATVGLLIGDSLSKPSTVGATANYEWLTTFKCNSFILSRNDDHAPNYQTAEEWIAEHGEDFDDVPAEELAAMRETNTIWHLQIYPHTPVGFHVWYGATADAVIGRARAALSAKKDSDGR